ncbi:hypothetical protein [Magnetofaba australis]|uniref:Uncharacterized protein n=1 Tax=Magnetofaba australis IT-1 TaxID=1434232 RepID=A0A1Y2K756_9PROT|nr:hypothetical protein [Magnetofaba australis]OSM06169.1 hypothetical protein MAIT1_01138 [Magnetofaba australis IT-1]
MSDQITDEQMRERILKLLLPNGSLERRQVVAFTMFYRKLFGRKGDDHSAERLQNVLNQLVAEGVIAQYPDIGVAEPPYIACTTGETEQ